MGIPLGPLRQALAAARMAGPGVAKATKKTIRVLHNEGNIDSLTGMLKGKSDYNVRATMDDMMYPSSKTAAGYANDGYSAASMAKLPKGTVTNRAGGGAIRARVMKLAQGQEAAAKARAFPDSRPPGLKRIQDDLEFLRTNKPAGRPAPAKKDDSWPVATWGSLPSHGKAASYTGLSSKNKSDIKKVVKAVKTKEASAKSAAFAKRRAILNNMKNRK